MNTVVPSPNSLPSRSHTASARVNPLLLAVVSSAVAAVLAAVGHIVFGLGEVPLVIATLLAASAVGWLNVDTPGRRRPRT